MQCSDVEFKKNKNKTDTLLSSSNPNKLRGQMWVLYICVSWCHLAPQLLSSSSTFFFSLFVALQSGLLVNISSVYRSNSLFSENTFWRDVNTTFVSFLDPWKYSSRDLTDYLLLNLRKALKLQNE